jgi:hypothetical protein
MATVDQRAHLKALMHWLVSKQPQIHWKEIRPMTTRGYLEQTLADHFAEKGTITMDCSETVTLLCRFAGLADPNGNSYNGNGYTGTLLNHLPHYTDAKAADVGALCVYGPGTGDHVTMVYEPGDDPTMFSHGKESDPELDRFSVIKAALRGPQTFLSIAKL